MNEGLREKQSRFVLMVALLIGFADLRGYELTFGDAYRDPRVKHGHPHSLHRSRLAVDFNVFKEGKYVGGAAEEYEELGVFWEALGGTWGGRFDPIDGPHFSLAHNGMA